MVQKCKVCSFIYKWNSQLYIHQLPAGNILMSSSILMCGTLPSQVLKMFSFMNMVAISRSTYHRHQPHVPAVVNEWIDSQNQVLDELRNWRWSRIIWRWSIPKVTNLCFLCHQCQRQCDVMMIYPLFGLWVFVHIDMSRWLWRSDLVKLLNKI